MINVLRACVFAMLAACSADDATAIDRHAASEAGAADARADASDAGAFGPCPTSIAAYLDGGACAGQARWCPRTFDDARAQCGDPVAPNLRVTTAPCDGYDTAGITGTDWARVEYFDHTTGALVAVVGYGDIPPGPWCIAGPAGFVLPTCSPSSDGCDAGPPDAAPADTGTD